MMDGRGGVGVGGVSGSASARRASRRKRSPIVGAIVHSHKKHQRLMLPLMIVILMMMMMMNDRRSRLVALVGWSRTLGQASSLARLSPDGRPPCLVGVRYRQSVIINYPPPAWSCAPNCARSNQQVPRAPRCISFSRHAIAARETPGRLMDGRVVRPSSRLGRARSSHAETYRRPEGSGTRRRVAR